jgi:hypothetical protein
MKPKMGPSDLHRRKSALLAGPELKVEVPPSEDVDLTRKLAKELIAEIFSYCVIETIDLGTLELVDSPWNLAQICASWRTLALSSPNLWNDVAVQFPYHRRGEFVHLRNLLEIFLSRSGNSSISLNITAAVDEYPLDPKLVDSIVNLVHLHIRQFRHLGLQPVGAMMPILQLPSDTVQALESVSLVFDEDDCNNIFRLETQVLWPRTFPRIPSWSTGGELRA